MFAIKSDLAHLRIRDMTYTLFTLHSQSFSVAGSKRTESTNSSFIIMDDILGLSPIKMGKDVQSSEIKSLH